MSAKEKKQLPSRLRERITIQFPVRTPDGLGGNTVSWSTLATVFAEVEMMNGSGREQVIAAQREGRAAYTIRIRKRNDISTAMRVQWQGKNLFIHGVVTGLTITELLVMEGGEQ